MHFFITSVIWFSDHSKKNCIFKIHLCNFFANFSSQTKNELRGKNSHFIQNSYFMRKTYFLKIYQNQVNKIHIFHKVHILKILFFHKIHIFIISFFMKFTLSKSHFSQNSHLQNRIFPQNSHFQNFAWQNSHFRFLIFHEIHIFKIMHTYDKIHISKISFFMKFTFLKFHFSWNSHF